MSGFCKIRRIAINPSGCNANPSQDYNPLSHLAFNSPLPGRAERGNMIGKCLAQEHDTMTSATARIQTAQSGVEGTNHEPGYCASTVSL